MRRLLVVTTMSVLVLLPAACGGTSSPDPAKAVADAPAKTAAGGSAKLEVTVVTVRTSSTGTTTTSTAPAPPTKVNGAVDFKAAKGTFTIGAASLGLPAGSAPVEAVLLGQVFYFKGLAGMSLPGKPWVKIDLGKLANAGGVAAQIQSLNPNSYLSQLKGVTGSVTTVGKEKVRGDNTTHYSFTVDLDKAAQLAPADQKAGIEAAAKTVVNKQEPTEVWLDGNGRVRRLKQTVQIASGALTGTTNLTLEYFDFGTKVAAAPPPADQTADFTPFLGGSGGTG
ncbi:MAG TPA: hypothetical protein VFA83_23435 [Acidimicrobiales bacterium]|nr:hypothetical protein [Acidimicrobiales bacterium]